MGRAVNRAEPSWFDTAVYELLNGASIAEASRKCGVRRETISRALSRPGSALKAEIERRRGAITESPILAEKALGMLGRLLDSAEPKVVVDAAQVVAQIQRDRSRGQDVLKLRNRRRIRNDEKCRLSVELRGLGEVRYEVCGFKAEEAVGTYAFCADHFRWLCESLENTLRLRYLDDRHRERLREDEALRQRLDATFDDVFFAKLESRYGDRLARLALRELKGAIQHSMLPKKESGT